jgi:hypothetical protein
MAKMKNWQYTRNGTEYTLSVGGLIKFRRGGWIHDSMGFYEWHGEPWEEIVTILGFRKSGLVKPKEGCFVDYLNGDGKIREAHLYIAQPPGQRQILDFQHLDE